MSNFLQQIRTRDIVNPTRHPAGEVTRVKGGFMITQTHDPLLVWEDDGGPALPNNEEIDNAD